MATNTSWKTQLTFSERLSALTSLTTAYRHGFPSADFPEAHSEATKIEGEAYANASSKDEYRALCQKEIDNYDNQAIAPDNDESFQQWAAEVKTEIKSRRGEKIGKYAKAVHDQEGLFSSFYKSINDEGLVVALKVTIPHLTGPPHDSEREARLLKGTSCTNIIPLLESFHEGGSRFVLVFPYMRYTLEALFHDGRLNARQTRSHLRDMFRALAHIHELGIIHRDIKPSNVLLQWPEGPVFLADFGIAWSPEDKSSEPPDEKITDVGTTCYRAPEILFGDKSYDAALDLWAMGCVVAEAIEPEHHPLFDAGPVGSDLALVHSIFTTLGTPTEESWPCAVSNAHLTCLNPQSRTRLPDWGKIEFREYPARSWEEILCGVSSLGRELAKDLVKYEGSERLTASQALEHPFLSF
ncbi:mitogen-activated protein kinase [Ophidiomyces ophidiicola]|nr:mitogen-activated protein kinase [Ophidiomyces ophidiicola]KAI1920099.1 mitogen-activated protein kinase [Ophidiomyces ophidiicola]KAI2378273.1 mitogen-activated protein kinase [Ophidiomyces ophidiicola]KAI2447611.1 mitogen-activated protein kinase [Ophidiomyces ophidiicola]